MKTIYKYPLTLTDRQQIRLPRDAQILDVQIQGGQLMLWALLDDDATPHARNVCVVGTGRLAGHVVDMDHVATVQAGEFVWHVFAEKSV